MKKKMKIVPSVVRAPTLMKMYGIVSSLAITGVMIEITRFISQLRTVATLTALSCMISLMYSQVIGPDENSNTAINDIIQMMVEVVH